MVSLAPLKLKAESTLNANPGKPQSVAFRSLVLLAESFAGGCLAASINAPRRLGHSSAREPRSQPLARDKVSSAELVL
jgi:hypothetical protein